MSLKRKAGSNLTANSSQKKPKNDFFAPKSSIAIGSSSTPQFAFDRREAGTVRLSTWNVNGIKSVNEKTFRRYLEAEDPYILILTETKVAQDKADIMCLKTRFKYQTWGKDPKAGQAGTAVLSKDRPINIVVGLPTWPDSIEDTQGRYVQMEFKNLYLVGTYVPNSGENFKSIGIKQKWNAAFSEHLHGLNAIKPVIWAGDFNCIPTSKDLDRKAQTFWDKMSGLSEIERGEFEGIINPGEQDSKRGKFVDIWRHLHPDAEEFTHSSAKFGAWRLDSFILSERILSNAKKCEIRHELKDLKLSDHWPVTLDILGLF